MAVTIKEGVSLQDYQTAYGYTEEELRVANPGIGKDLVAGQMLELPTAERLNDLFLEQESAIQERAPSFSDELAYEYERPTTPEQSVKLPYELPAFFGNDEPITQEPDIKDVTKGEFPLTTGGLSELTEEEVLRLPSDNFLKHLRLREGYREDVYLDSEGKPTVGVGHYDPELKEGDIITQEQVSEYLREDSQEAWDAAVEQGEKLGRTDPKFLEGLASVNFQLGTSWYKEHKNTWKLMSEGKWEDAAVEAANSKWEQQTPVRVVDFQNALTGRG